MTKVTIIGKVNKEKNKKPIELKSILYADGTTRDSKACASDWDFIELISENYRSSGLDLLFCYNKSRFGGADDQRALYLGHFNDGIVE